MRAALEIVSDTSVMAVGGWSGDPVATLHSASHTREIAGWVAEHYPGTFIGGSTVYHLA